MSTSQASAGATGEKAVPALLATASHVTVKPVSAQGKLVPDAWPSLAVWTCLSTEALLSFGRKLNNPLSKSQVVNISKGYRSGPVVEKYT